MCAQKADVLVNQIASAEPNMSAAGAVSKAFLDAAGPQLQAVITYLNDFFLLNTWRCASPFAERGAVTLLLNVSIILPSVLLLPVFTVVSGVV